MDKMKDNLLTLDSLLGYSNDRMIYERGFYFVSWPEEQTTQTECREYRSKGFCFLLCDAGELRLDMGGVHYAISRNSLLVIRPDSQLVIHSCCNFSAQCIVFSPLIKFFNAIPVRYVTAFYMGALKNPVVRLTDQERSRIDTQVENLKNVSNYGGTTEFYDYAVQSGIAMLLCLVCDLKQNRRETERYRYGGRNNDYFGRFLQLLFENFQRERQVRFYADRLCITPKYLSAIVVQLSGKSALKWIHEIVVQEACFRLIYGEESIQQIAYRLNFPNQSFFGKFFKKHMGCSPSEYRGRRLVDSCLSVY